MSTYFGPARIIITPNERFDDGKQYIHRARWMLGELNHKTDRMVRNFGNALIDVRQYPHEKQIYITLPPTRPKQDVDYGYFLSPTSSLATMGYTGDSYDYPGIPRALAPGQTDWYAYHSLTYLEGIRPTSKILRYDGFKTDLVLGQNREFVGTSSNRQGISWDNAPTIHNDHLIIFGGAVPSTLPRTGGRGFDLGYMIAWQADGDSAATYKKVISSNYDVGTSKFEIVSASTHWNCLFYKGKVVNLPEAYFQASYGPLVVDYLDRTVYNVRIGGCYYKDGKICYVRSAPFYSAPSALADRCPAEELVFADAVLTDKSLSIGTTENIAASVTIPTRTTWNRNTWNDWVFNNDGSEAVSIKILQDGASALGGYFKVAIDYDLETVSGSYLTEANLLKLDYGLDNTLLKMYGTNDLDPVNPKWTFTLPTGQVAVYSAVQFSDLRHDAYIFGDYNVSGGNETLKFVLSVGGILTTIYDETRVGSSGTDIYGNFIEPLMVYENDDEYTIVGVSCQISPGNGWPTKVYNSNSQLLGYAKMIDKTDPALNPIYLT